MSADAETQGPVRKYLYLVLDHPNDDLVGKVETREKPYTVAEKNKETRVEMRNTGAGESYTQRVVGLGYHDFESGDVSNDRFAEVQKEKLAEIDERHLHAAGLDPEEVLA